MRRRRKCCSDHSCNQKVNYTAVKAIQLVASAPHQVGEPTQVLIQFLENSSEMSHYKQKSINADIKHQNNINSDKMNKGIQYAMTQVAVRISQ
jgi:hypothetical protein